MDTHWTPGNDPFHAGEHALQARAGLRARMADIGARVIRDHMPDQHRDFFALLHFLLVGSVDGQGQPWASALHGAPGFVQSPDARRLHIGARPPAGSALAAHLRAGASLGLLGMQPHTRRRNRMNGRVVALDDGGFEVAVEHSFGNCPKYIRVREAHAQTGAAPPAASEARPALDDEARALIAAADTLFIASAHAGQVDVSHRGGAPGFVRLDEEGRLLLPDYAGNFFFNTLGNLLLEPRAGLLFIDFERGDLLQLSAVSELVWDGPLVDAHPGALRLLRLSVTGMVRTRGGLPLRWSEAGG